MKKITLATLILTSIYTVPAFSSRTVAPAPQSSANSAEGCSKFVQANRPLHQEHKALLKKYRALTKAIREYYKKKGCIAEGQSLLLPVENRALGDKISALTDVIRGKGIVVGG